MIFDFSSKTAVITGGSRGIGRAIAEALLSFGCKIIITSTASRAPKWLPVDGAADHRHLDFCDQASIDAFLAQLNGVDNIDILVNNAGAHSPQTVTEIDEASWNKLFRINVVGPMLLMRSIGQRMKERKNGRIVNVGSIAGTVCKPNSGAYAASKMALIGLTRAGAIDFAPYNVLVNTLCPGTTQTEMVEKILSDAEKKHFLRNVPLGRFAEPAEIANFAVFLASDLNTYITGQTIIVDGGTAIQ